MDRRIHDGRSCRFVMKIKEVAKYPYSKSSSVLERRPSMDRCASDDPSYHPTRLMERAAEEIAQVSDDGIHDGPSCRFVMKFREVFPVPEFQEFKYFGTETLDGPLCL